MMITYRGRGSYRKHLIDGTNATWQGDKHITLIHHQLFTICKVVARNLNVHVITSATCFLHLHWHHANRMSASLFGSLGHTLHKSLIHTTINDTMAIHCDPLP